MARRRSGRALDALLLLDKPAGMSSNRALQIAKRLYGAAKAGHTGSLDPLATGLLPVCFGGATRLGTDLLNADKAYVATARLGIVTASGDADGEVLERRDASGVDGAALQSVLGGLRGDIEQVPPMVSALKVGGRRLYALAREGVIVERAPRRVRIHELEAEGPTDGHFELRVACSKGTYVRSLVIDIGEALGCGAHVTALRRTAVADFRIDRALTLEALETMTPRAREACLLPADRLVASLPATVLDDAGRTDFRHGRTIRLEVIGDILPQLHRIYGPERDFLGIGDVDGGAGSVRLRPRRVLPVPSGGESEVL